MSQHLHCVLSFCSNYSLSCLRYVSMDFAHLDFFHSHSLMQIFLFSNSPKLDRGCWWTAIFRSRQRFSIGFKSESLQNTNLFFPPQAITLCLTCALAHCQIFALDTDFSSRILPVEKSSSCWKVRMLEQDATSTVLDSWTGVTWVLGGIWSAQTQLFAFTPNGSKSFPKYSQILSHVF